MGTADYDVDLLNMIRRKGFADCESVFVLRVLIL